MEICLKGWRETLYRLDPLKKTEKNKKQKTKTIHGRELCLFRKSLIFFVGGDSVGPWNHLPPHNSDPATKTL